MGHVLNSASGVLMPERSAEIRETTGPSGRPEVHAGTYTVGGGLPHAQLSALRMDYALSSRRASLSVGGPGRASPDHPGADEGKAATRAVRLAPAV
jgi:hypothetical protein